MIPCSDNCDKCKKLFSSSKLLMLFTVCLALASSTGYDLPEDLSKVGSLVLCFVVGLIVKKSCGGKGFCSFPICNTDSSRDTETSAECRQALPKPGMMFSSPQSLAAMQEAGDQPYALQHHQMTNERAGTSTNTTFYRRLSLEKVQQPHGDQGGKCCSYPSISLMNSSNSRAFPMCTLRENSDMVLHFTDRPGQPDSVDINRPSLCDQDDWCGLNIATAAQTNSFRTNTSGGYQPIKVKSMKDQPNDGRNEVNQLSLITAPDEKRMPPLQQKGFLSTSNVQMQQSIERGNFSSRLVQRRYSGQAGQKTISSYMESAPKVWMEHLVGQHEQVAVPVRQNIRQNLGLGLDIHDNVVHLPIEGTTHIPPTLPPVQGIKSKLPKFKMGDCNSFFCTFVLVVFLACFAILTDPRVTQLFMETKEKIKEKILG